MQFAALFIEYFVSGATAVLWLAPLLGVTRQSLTGFQQGAAVFLLPALYVLGHAIDGVSFLLVGPFKSFLKRQARRKYEVVISGSETAYVLFRSAELGKQLQALSSRDRIARGAVFNILMIAVAVAVKPDFYSVTPANRFNVAAAVALAAVVMFAMWWRFEASSRRFKREAVRLIHDDQSAMFNGASSSNVAPVDDD